MKYIVSFKDGVSVTIDTETDEVQVNSMSYTDVEFNNIANKAINGDETNQIRLINLINNRLRTEAI